MEKNIVKITIMGLVAIFALLLLQCGGWFMGREVRGIYSASDIVILYQDELDTESYKDFYNTVLSVESSDGDGHDLPPGVNFLASISGGGHEGESIDFWPSATNADKQDLLNKLAADDRVYAIFLNLAPADILCIGGCTVDTVKLDARP